MGRARPLAEVYRHFGAAAARTSPLDQHVATALSSSDQALQAIGRSPVRSRHPALVLAALHDLALAGRAPALAAAYADGDVTTAAGAAVDTLLGMADAVVATAVRRRIPTPRAHPSAALYPALAEAARRAGACAVGLVDIGCSAGFDLDVDRVGITYDDGRRLGDPSSPVQLSCSVVGGRPVPARRVPPVLARIGVDVDPLDVTDPDDVRWLRACISADRTDLAAALDAEVALAAAAPPLLLRGDVVELLPDAVARVPADALPVVTTTWALSRLAPQRRRHFLQRLHDVAAYRPVAWVSVEGVGVAPAVPTLGDRPASGHSILGLAVSDRAVLHTEAIGRCWSRGRLVSWLADEQPGQAGSSSVA